MNGFNRARPRFAAAAVESVSSTGSAWQAARTFFVHAALALSCVMALPAKAQTTVEYIHTDGLGSVVAVTDANRNVIERREYEPYGAQLTPAVQDGPGYTGHVMDTATGLTYMQQRYYDPQVGRFLSVDPVTALDNGDMRHFNRYAYAYNNPYLFTDPDGRKGKKIGWAVELGTGTMRKLSRVTLEQAVKIRRAGGNFLGDSTRVSRRVETTAHGRADRIRHDGHALKDDSGNVVGKGLPHYQTDGVSGHSFMDKAGSVAAALLVYGAVQLENTAQAAESAAEVADNIDPFRIGDAGAGSDCATGCGSTFKQSDVKLDGFQGVFRVEGRIDSKKLHREMDKK